MSHRPTGQSGVFRLCTAIVIAWLVAAPGFTSNAIVEAELGGAAAKFDPVTQSVMRLLYWEQHWGMFAPSVPRREHRVVLRGRTHDGRLIDPRTGLPPHEGPFTAYDGYINIRFARRFIGKDAVRNAEAYRAWTLKQWAEDESHPLASLEVVLLKQIHRWDGEAKALVFKTLRLAGP